MYNAAGEQQGTMTLTDAVFGVAAKSSVVHQVYVAQQANAREPWADTKNRGEVRGGGKKPWAQKGTGRARHGSIRSPIWKGGGVTFGPVSERNYKQKVNKKMNRLAVKMLLSDKVADNKLMVLGVMENAGKTKAVVSVFNKLPSARRSTLLLVEKMNDAVSRAVRNVPKIDVMPAKDVSVVDLMHHQYVVVMEAGVTALEKRLA